MNFLLASSWYTTHRPVVNLKVHVWVWQQSGRMPRSGAVERKHIRFCPCLPPSFPPSQHPLTSPSLSSSGISQSEPSQKNRITGRKLSNRVRAVRYLPELYGGGFYNLSLLLWAQDKNSCMVCRSLTKFYFHLLHNPVLLWVIFQ